MKKIYFLLFLSLLILTYLVIKTTIYSDTHIDKRENFDNNLYIDNIFKHIMTHSKYSPKKISDSPWIVTLDNFLSEEECNQIINIPENWNPSTTIENNKRIIHKGRISDSFYCNQPGCSDKKIINKINERINKVTTIEKNNYEYVQLTKYIKGGFYGQHHDFILEKDDTDTFTKTGPRTLTVLLYLTDTFTGGETSFVTLGHSIKPRTGRALIWTNVHNDLTKDERTQHEAMPVKSGTKIISQIWIHSKEYKK